MKTKSPTDPSSENPTFDQGDCFDDESSPYYIDKDVSLHSIQGFPQRPWMERKDFEAGIFKDYQFMQFYVKVVGLDHLYGISTGGDQEDYGIPIEGDIFELLKDREIKLEWADFRGFLNKHNREVGSLEDARYVIEGHEYSRQRVICLEDGNLVIVSLNGDIEPLPEDELINWLFGRHGFMPLVVFRSLRKLIRADKRSE